MSRDLFSWQESPEEARDEAIAQVGKNAPADWFERALEAIARIAALNFYLTTDDVWDKVDSPPEPRAMGAVMEKARRRGLIKPTDRTQKSRRRECHARPLRVWTSMIYGVDL
jgi:hypothetical protein